MSNIETFIREYESETGDKVTSIDRQNLAEMLTQNWTPREYARTREARKNPITYGEYVLLQEYMAWRNK